MSLHVVYVMCLLFNSVLLTGSTARPVSRQYIRPCLLGNYSQLSGQFLIII